MKQNIKRLNVMQGHITVMYVLFFLVFIIAIGGMVAINKVEKSIIEIESNPVFDGAWDDFCRDGYELHYFEGSYHEFLLQTNAATTKYNVTEKVGYFNDIGGFLDFELAKQTLQRQTALEINKITGEDDVAVMQKLVIQGSADLKLIKMQSKSKNYIFYETCKAEPIREWAYQVIKIEHPNIKTFEEVYMEFGSNEEFCKNNYCADAWVKQ